MQLYKQARQMAAQRFGLIDSIPAYKAAVAGKVEPDKFFSKYVENANRRELKGSSRWWVLRTPICCRTCSSAAKAQGALECQ